AAVVAGAIEQQSPAVVLFAGTAMGRDLAPRLAARFGCGLASDCVALMVENGAIQARRPVYSGKAYAIVAFNGMAMATLRPNVFPLAERRQAACEIVPLPVEVEESSLQARVVRIEAAEKRELDVAEAGVIVSGGRGLREPANF